MEQEKLYSPVNFFLRDKVSALEGQYDDVHYWRDEITHEEAFEHIAEIKAALADDRRYYDHGCGLAEYLGKGLLNDKVQSLLPDLELHGDKLWTVAHLQLNEPLTSKEMADLKSWWGGQLSDGWGEGFEQREIKVGRGELYVEPWSSSAGFFIATQAEFDRRIGIEQAAPNTNEESLSTRDAQLAKIAQQHCHVETLETRMSDGLDFHEVSVWGLKAALQAAFDAGVAHQLAKETAVQLPEPEAAIVVDAQSLRDALEVRLEENLADIMNDLRSDISGIYIPAHEVVSLAERITTVSAAYEYLTGSTIPLDQAEYLIQFQNPLEVVADRWPENFCTNEEMSRVLWDVCDRQDALQDYPLVTSMPPTVREEAAVPASGKPSLLAGLREAKARAANENATRAKDKPTNHPEPEL